MIENSLVNPAESRAESMSENDKLLMEKMVVIRNGVVQHLKISDNPMAISGFMYDTIMNPQKANKIIEKLGIEDSEKFPNRTSTIKKPIEIDVTTMPSKEVFVGEIARAITADPDFEKCIYHGAQEQIEAMLEMGPVRIWTAGDDGGTVDAEGEFYPGTHGQMKKIARAKIFNAIRNSYARENFTAEKYLEKRTDVLSVRSTENKFDLIPSIAEEFKEKGIKTLCLVEDNLPYLMQAEKLFLDAGFDVKTIWIRQGWNKNKIPKESGQDLTYYMEKYNAINSVAGIKSVLENYKDDPNQTNYGFVVDFDDVIMNSELKLKAQGEAMLKKMKEKKWI